MFIYVQSQFVKEDALAIFFFENFFLCLEDRPD